MSATRISCSEYSFPAVPGQHERIGIVRLLGFELVDLALFLADGSELVADPAASRRCSAPRSTEHGLASEDLFLAVGETVEEIAPNQRDAALRERRRREFAAAARSPPSSASAGITSCPGVTWAEDPAASWERVRRGARLARRGRPRRSASSSGSRPTPARSRPCRSSRTRLCADVPGLRLTLDLSHFELQSVTLDRMLTLVPLAGHLHVRAAKPGAIQVRWRDNETDFAALVEALRADGYPGAYCVEYVPMPKWRCDEMDVVTEALATRSALIELGVS